MAKKIPLNVPKEAKPGTYTAKPVKTPKKRKFT